MIDMSFINVCYYISTICNQKCDYCFRKCYTDKYEPTKNDIDIMINNLKQYHIKTFMISGGEPSISKNVYYLIDKLYNINVDKIHIISNQTNIEFYKNLSKYDEKRFEQHISIHPMYYNNSIKNTIEYVATHFSNYFAYLLLDKRHFDKIKDFYNTLYQKYFIGKTEFNIVRDKHYDISMTIKSDYTDKKFLSEITKLFNIDLEKDITSLKYVPKQYKNKLCCANHISINPNGSIYVYRQCFPELGSILSQVSMYKCGYNHIFHTKKCEIFKHKCWNLCAYNSHED